MMRFRVENLEPARTVLHEECEGAEVGVLGDASDARVADLRGRDRGVVQQAELASPLGVQGTKSAGKQVERQSERAHKFQVQPVTFVVVAEHVLLKPREIVLLRPDIWIKLVLRRTAVEVFLSARRQPGGARNTTSLS